MTPPDPQTSDWLAGLPLSASRDEFVRALRGGSLLLEAEPGAGKSTLAPLWALEAAAAEQQVWLVQPRVLAARALARRLAALRGEPLGRSVGLQVPFERVGGEATRLWLMTPGILLQRLLADPELTGVGVVMLDEIHERAVDQDTAWAWLQEAQVLREDLALVLMSATPDPALQRQVGQRLHAPGRCFPVTLEHQPPRADEPLAEQVCRALAACDWQQRTVLVFLPGWRDIEQTAAQVTQRWPGRPVYRLHSRVDDAEQARALDPAQGRRLILATNIAETSLTIPDVTLVIDSGWQRRPDYEQGTGIARLKTRRISRASAEQRRGRAGRVQAGHCVRLWPESEHLAPADLPEIRATDCLPLALRLAHWGTPVEQLDWLEAPGSLALSQARARLQQWGQLDEAERITAAGRLVAALGTHPRVAALLQGQRPLPEQTLLLALALHFDLSADDDMDAWLAAARRQWRSHPHWRQQAERWLRVLDTRLSPEDADRQALALALSDRIGCRQPSGRYRLNSGISVLPGRALDSPWAVFPLIVPRSRGHSGPALALEPDLATRRRLSSVNETLERRRDGWGLRRQWLLGGALVDEQWQPLAPQELPQRLVAHVAELAGQQGLDALHWDAIARRLLARARLAARRELLALPDLSEAALLRSLPQWLGPFLDQGSALERLPWLQALRFHLGHDVCAALERWLPERLTLPSGRVVAVQYPVARGGEGDEPVVSGKLQEFFGCARLLLADGRVPLRIHLVSPNGSPLAITADLASFWQHGYPEVRKQMRGRYPRHPWPEDPMAHPATALTQKALARKASDS